MSLWPFARKGDRKRPRSGLSDLDVPAIIEPVATTPAAPLRTPASSSASPSIDASSRPAPKKRRTNGNSPTKQLHRRPRAQSFSSRRDSIALDVPSEHVARERRARATFATPPQPQLPTTPRPKTTIIPNDDDLQEVPTLRKRDSTAAAAATTTTTQAKQKAKRRSSRRSRKSTIERNDAPLRPAVDESAAGGAVKKDSKVVKSGFGFGRSSIISLPTPESIHLSLSSDSEHGFKVSRLDSLSPQPTLHCSGPDYQPVGRSKSQRNNKNLSMISTHSLKMHKRVDSLADNLDASELRVVMERDNRRRQRKQQRDRDRAEARLSKRAATLADDEERARQMGVSPPRNHDRGMFGRELEVFRTPSTIWAPRRGSDVSMEEHIPRFSFQSERPEDEQQQHYPVQSEQLNQLHQRSSVQQLDQPTQLQQAAEIIPAESKAPSARMSLGVSIPRGGFEMPTIEVKSPVSEAQEPIPTPPMSPAENTLKRKQTASRTSFTSEQGKFTVVKLPRVEDEVPQDDKKGKKKGISTFFRWPSRNRAPATPQSFSNASREEMGAAHRAQSRAMASSSSRSQETISQMQRSNSNLPRRTRSRFKEDLPEHPMSPPPSRLQSPEMDAPDMASLHPSEATRSREYLSVQHTPRSGTPVSGGRRSMETIRNTPISWQRANSTEPPASTSYASVDSEASWFSGRAGRKSPMSMSRTLSRATYRQSMHHQSYESLSNQTEDHIMDDEYMAQLSPLSLNDTATNRQSVGEGLPSSDDEDLARDDYDGARWGAVEGGQARVVVAGRQGRIIKSCQGIEGVVVDDDASASSSTRRSIISTGSVVLSRARSVLFGKGKPRPISIGSARVLDGGERRRSTSK